MSRENVIDDEVLKEKIVSCVHCGARNRLVRLPRKVRYQCGACHTPLANPFTWRGRVLNVLNGKRSSAVLMASLGIAIGILSVLCFWKPSVAKLRATWEANITALESQHRDELQREERAHVLKLQSLEQEYSEKLAEAEKSYQLL